MHDVLRAVRIVPCALERDSAAPVDNGPARAAILPQNKRYNDADSLDHDARALQEVAALVWNARTLSEGMLGFSRAEPQRAALKHLIALQSAVSLHLQDKLEQLSGRRSSLPAEGFGQHKHVEIYRCLILGDFTEMLAHVALFEIHMRRALCTIRQNAFLTPTVTDVLQLAADILNAAPRLREVLQGDEKVEAP